MGTERYLELVEYYWQQIYCHPFPKDVDFVIRIMLPAFMERNIAPSRAAFILGELELGIQLMPDEEFGWKDS